MGRRGGEARSGERLRRGVYCQWVRDMEMEMGSYEKGSVRMGTKGLRGKAIKGFLATTRDLEILLGALEKWIGSKTIRKA